MFLLESNTINRGMNTMKDRMMLSHKLKIDPESFEAVREGKKTFTIRINDRNFHVGDTLELHETKYSGDEMKSGKPLIYTGRIEVREVSHMLGKGYGLMEGWCILSFKG